MAIGSAGIALEAAGNAFQSLTGMNDSVGSLLEPFLVHFTAHFTARLCLHSSGKI